MVFPTGNLSQIQSKTLIKGVGDIRVNVFWLSGRYWSVWPVAYDKGAERALVISPGKQCLQVGPGGRQGLVYVAIAILIDFQLDID